jgi:hypothetical protein
MPTSGEDASTLSSFSLPSVYFIIVYLCACKEISVCMSPCSASWPSTSKHQRPCQLLPLSPSKPGSCLHPRHIKQLLHVYFFTAREKIKPLQHAKDSPTNSPSAYAAICTYLLPTYNFKEQIHHIENISHLVTQKQSRQLTHVQLSSSHLIRFSYVSVRSLRKFHTAMIYGRLLALWGHDDDMMTSCEFCGRFPLEKQT